MRPAMALVFILLLAGCVTPQETDDGTSPALSSPGGAPDPTTSADPDNPTPTPDPPSGSPPPCGGTTTARWLEEDVYDRSRAAGFPAAAPYAGFPVADEALLERFGPANVTYTSIGIGQTGTTGTARELFLTLFQGQFRGTFAEGATRAEIREEFLAFARRVLSVDQATLEAHADAFADNLTADGTRRLSVSGPFQVGRFLSELHPGASERWVDVDFVAVESTDGAAGVSIETRRQNALTTNRLDWVEYSATGGRSQFWASANATFDSLGWPRPDLSDVQLSMVVC